MKARLSEIIPGAPEGWRRWLFYGAVSLCAIPTAAIAAGILLLIGAIGIVASIPTRRERKRRELLRQLTEITEEL